jgi:hypothetical protein
MSDNIFGDIYINDRPYRIDYQTWRGKDVIDFSPRATVPGGSFTMSDLGLYQPLVQSDWRHGFGFHWYSDSSGYLQTIGNIDTRQNDIAMMFTAATSSDTNNNNKTGMTVFNDAVYTWGAAGLRKFSGGSWTAPYTAAAVNFALATATYLFFCPNGLRIQKMNAAGTITDAGLDANSTDYAWLILHNGYIYAGKDGTNAIHFDNSPTLATLQGNSSDTNRILVGVGDNPASGAIVYNGNLYVRKSDGIWMVGEDRIARRMLDFTSEESSTNLRSWAVINGFLVFPMRDRILQWNGARVSDITPHKLNDEFPFLTYGAFNAFVGVGDFLYIMGRTNETNADLDLLCFDGVGWHRLLNIASDFPDGSGIGFIGYEAVNNRLWYHVLNTAGGSNTTYYVQFQSRSSFPYANFPTTGQHSLITSRIDAGFRRVKKSMANLIVEARNCSATVFLRVYYALDGGDWVLWRDVKENGIITLNNPGGSPTREFDYVQFRFDFITDTAAQTPILEGYTMRFIMRPITKMGYSFTVIAANNYQYGLYEDNRSPQEIYKEIMEFRNSIAPITITDMYGVEHIGYLTSLQEQPLYRNVEGSESQLELRYLLNFVEI